MYENHREGMKRMKPDGKSGMRTGLKIFLGTAGAWIPQRWLIRMSRRDLVLPLYHAVSDEPMPHVAGVYPVRNRAGFRRDLDFLLKHYEPVGLERLLSPAGRSKPEMFLSFDDGLSEIYEIVAPILLARGIPAAIFVNTGFLDNRDVFYRYKSSLLLDRLEKINYSPAVTGLMQSRYHLENTGRKCVNEFLLGITHENRQELDRVAELLELDFSTFLKIRKPYMSLVQVKELADRGFYIGTHSISHPLFAEIDPPERFRQYRESMEFLHQELGNRYGIFSFPFSDDGVPLDFFRQIESLESPRLDASFGTAGLKDDPLPFHHHRIQMEAGRCPAHRYIRGEYLYYLAKATVGRNQIKRR